MRKKIIFQEQASSVAERKQLHAAMDYVRENDIFVVSKVDRLARSASNLMTILDSLDQRRVDERRHSVQRLAAEASVRAVIAAQLGIGEATVYRILAEAKAQHP